MYFPIFRRSQMHDPRSKMPRRISLTMSSEGPHAGQVGRDDGVVSSASQGPKRVGESRVQLEKRQHHSGCFKTLMHSASETGGLPRSWWPQWKVQRRNMPSSRLSQRLLCQCAYPGNMYVYCLPQVGGYKASTWSGWTIFCSDAR